MKEKDLNSIINRSFSQYGFSHKIADGIGGISVQNPFDGFSVMHNLPWYWESKLLKGYKAFNFKKIEDHQIENLLKIKNGLGNNCCSLIILGVFEPRQYFDIFFFDISYIVKLMNKKKSILKKELLELKKSDNYKKKTGYGII